MCGGKEKLFGSCIKDARRTKDKIISAFGGGKSVRVNSMQAKSAQAQSAPSTSAAMSASTTRKSSAPSGGSVPATPLDFDYDLLASKVAERLSFRQASQDLDGHSGGATDWGDC